ncbi:hypothetical protein P7C70_g5693, partial [Phenoliferia sp. Uapishka_3]
MLAAGIESESGLELLNSVRYSTCPPGDTLFRGLDALFQTPLNRGDLIEIQGLPSTGKTQFLLFITMTSLLPTLWKPVISSVPILHPIEIGGKEKTVVWFDCTQRFDIERLAHLIRSVLSSRLGNSLAGRGAGEKVEEVEREVVRCLGRLVVYKPGSTTELAATILSRLSLGLPNGGLNLSYLIIDGLSEFYHADQFQKEQASKSKTTSTPPTPPIRHLITSLTHLRRTLSPVVLVSTWVLNSSKNSSKNGITHRSTEFYPFFSPALPSPWPSITSPAQNLDPSDPIDNSIGLRYHITTYAPEMRKGKEGESFEEAFRKRKVGRGKGMEEFKAILRERGGGEVGHWEFDVLEDRIDS